MRLIGNILWNFPGFGFLFALFYLLLGALLSMTVILHPIGKACYNISKLMFAPFGKTIIKEVDLVGSENVNIAKKTGGLVANLIWLTAGIPLMFAHLFAAFAMFCGIITIPFAFVHLKLARMAIWPIGAKVVSKAVAKAAEEERGREEFAKMKSE